MEGRAAVGRCPCTGSQATTTSRPSVGADCRARNTAKKTSSFNSITCAAALLTDGTCDFTQENLYPSPDASGNDPLAMVKQAFASSGVVLHLNIGNAVPETTCTDSPRAALRIPQRAGRDQLG